MGYFTFSQLIIPGFQLTLSAVQRIPVAQEPILHCIRHDIMKTLTGSGTTDYGHVIIQSGLPGILAEPYSRPGIRLR